MKLAAPPWADPKQPNNGLLHDICAALGDMPVPASSLVQQKQSGTVRLIGGCVRDAVLGQQSADYDLATPLWPEEVLYRLTAAHISATPLRLDHGVVIAHRDSKVIEIATLRRDISTDGRHADVTFTSSWHEDALRRDFTLNSLSATLDGRIFDPLGTGLADAKAGRVRFVGDPHTRLREDRLRALRFIRFTASHGNRAPEPEGLRACQSLGSKLKMLSPERVWSELRRMLSLPSGQAMACLEMMEIIGASKNLLGCQFDVTVPLPDPCMGFVANIAIIRLAAALALKTEMPCDIASKFETQLRLSRTESRLLQAALSWRSLSKQNLTEQNLAPLQHISDRPTTGYPTRPPEPKDVRLARLEASAEEVAAQLLLWGCKAPELLAAYDLRELLTLALSEPPKFPLSGHRLRKIANGPELGTLLRRLKRRWAASGYNLSADQLFKIASEIAYEAA